MYLLMDKAIRVYLLADETIEPGSVDGVGLELVRLEQLNQVLHGGTDLTLHLNVNNSTNMVAIKNTPPDRNKLWNRGPDKIFSPAPSPSLPRSTKTGESSHYLCPRYFFTIPSMFF